MSRLIFKSLSMKNFATFENQIIDFDNGFNGITGETGSGKSLILDAFQLLLGQRADKKLVRKGTDFSVVEGTFATTHKSVHLFFDELGFPLDENNEVVIKRIIYTNGKSKCFLNHLQCPLSIINRFSRKYIDLVGQFENQKLTSPEYQLKLIDLAGKGSQNIEKYCEEFSRYKTLKQELDSKTINRDEKKRKEDYIVFQIAEFEKLTPSLNREQELIKLKSEILSRQENIHKLDDLMNLISEGSDNLLSRLHHASKIIDNSGHFIEQKQRDVFNDAVSLIEDFSYSISSVDIKENENNIEEVLEELDLYQSLKRKFQVSTEELESIYQEFLNELNSLQNIDNEITKIQKEIDVSEKILFNLADLIHKARVLTVSKLDQKITKELKTLNMAGATFKISIEKAQELGPFGLSIVSFTAETNPGEGFYKINDIASGGELSRILLTLRNIISQGDTISIFFFDEIDTGIGGETANLIGKKLKELSTANQVLVITHLAQIAKVADQLIHVDKKSLKTDDKIRTISYISSPNKSQREEILNQLAGL